MLKEEGAKQTQESKRNHWLGTFPECGGYQRSPWRCRMRFSRGVSTKSIRSEIDFIFGPDV
jgi:hypothetical protein